MANPEVKNGDIIQFSDGDIGIIGIDSEADGKFVIFAKHVSGKTGLYLSNTENVMSFTIRGNIIKPLTEKLTSIE